jgi:hypothetical protein
VEWVSSSLIKNKHGKENQNYPSSSSLFPVNQELQLFCPPPPVLLLLVVLVDVFGPRSSLRLSSSSSRGGSWDELGCASSVVDATTRTTRKAIMAIARRVCSHFLASRSVRRSPRL